MNKTLIRLAVIASVLAPLNVQAEPVTLKLAFFSSDRSMSYRAAVQPFIEAVNAEGKGLIEIVLYSGGVLGREIPQQPDAVRQGIADIAFVVPGYTPERFPGTSVVELPGLFRNTEEGTRVYTRMIAAGALKGYEDFVVLGAYVTEPETIHARVPVASIDDLKGKRIRVNNASAAAAFQVLGALPVLMPITQTANALSNGTIDAASVPRTPLRDYGIMRVAANHYFLGTGGAPLALLMNRQRFEALPPPAQAIIRKYSGEWTAGRFIEVYDGSDKEVLEQLQADPKRRVVFPSQPDIDRAQHAFSAVVAGWLEESPDQEGLLAVAHGELTRLRAGQ
jgi:TRAP-type C4-dicarboxylate transport system substrate-binding protein